MFWFNIINDHRHPVVQPLLNFTRRCVTVRVHAHTVRSSSFDHARIACAGLWRRAHRLDQLTARHTHTPVMQYHMQADRAARIAKTLCIQGDGKMHKRSLPSL